jgi:hypothetical protein
MRQSWQAPDCAAQQRLMNTIRFEDLLSTNPVEWAQPASDE